MECSVVSGSTETRCVSTVIRYFYRDHVLWYFGWWGFKLRVYRIIEYVKLQKKQKKYYDGILINVMLFSLC